MIYLISVILSVLGFVGIASSQSFIGFIVGTQILFFGFSSLFVFIAYGGGSQEPGLAFGIFILAIGAVYQAVSYALAARIYQRSNRVAISDLKRIRN